MSRPKDHDPKADRFEFSQEELRASMKDFAQVLVLRGQITENNKLWPEKAGGPTSLIFRKPIPATVIRDIFYKNDEGLIAEEGIAEYLAPYRLEPDDTITTESIAIFCPTRMSGTNIDRLQWLHIGRDDDLIKGSIDVEYSRDGVRISPNDIDVNKGLNDERILTLLDDMSALERPLTHDDIESLRKVQAFIAGQ